MNIEKGQLVKFHTPFADENPNQVYVCLDFYPAWEQVCKDGTVIKYKAKADIQALNSTLTFVPINSVFADDLMIVEL